VIVGWDDDPNGPLFGVGYCVLGERLSQADRAKKHRAKAKKWMRFISNQSIVFVMMIDINAATFMNPQEIKIDSGLYLVPTPIGNLRDVTLRALDVLKGCDAIICEDSRVTGKLLKAYGIQKKKIVYNDYASLETRDYILGRLKSGDVLAMVSDAGTPLISDPGHKLVQACLMEDVYITALPGANAVLPALQLSGLPSDKFTFAGFLPHKDKAVCDVLNTYKDSKETLIFYDSASRIEKTLKYVHEIYGDRSIAVVREISKLYEESVRGSPSVVINHFLDNPTKGEFVLLISGFDGVLDFDLDSEIKNAFAQNETVKALSLRLSSKYKLKKRDVYNRALELSL
jgi:16S rRNA (cytidine1402-2'-O)-methyltransferase